MPTITSSNPAREPASPRLVMEWQTSRPARSIVHEPLFGASPAITLAPLGARRGTLKLHFATASEAAECYAMHMDAAILTLSAGISDTTETLVYVVAGGDLTLTLDPETARVTILEVPFMETTQ